MFFNEYNMFNINTPLALYEYMSSNIKYGYINRRTNKAEYDDYTNFYKLYKLQTPKEIMTSKVGVCWDQVELERYIFENYIKLDFETYYIQCYNTDYSTHTFLVYYINNECYYFENSFEKYRCIKKFNTLNELLREVSGNVANFNNSSKYEIYKYTKPKFGINVKQFMAHCLNGELIYKHK